MPYDRPPVHRKRFEVSIRDCDGLGHVNHVVYLTYLEMARAEWALAVRGTKGHAGLGFIFARIEADYRAEATFGDVLEVSIWPVRVGTKSWTLGYEIRRVGSEELVLEAQTVLVSYDFEAGTSIPVQPELRAALEAGR